MRPHGKFAVVDASNPEAFAQCDRCGQWYNRSDLVWQDQWSGTHLYNIGQLVCRRVCYDKPQEQLRTIILPPDPPPVINARPPNFTYENDGPVQTVLAQNTSQGAGGIVVVDASGFELNDFIWVQLNNADLAEMQIGFIDLGHNVLGLTSPLPFSAPKYGVVSFSREGVNPLNRISSQFAGGGNLQADTVFNLNALANLPGQSNLSVSANLSLAVSALLAGASSLHTIPQVQTISAVFAGSGLLFESQAGGSPLLDFSDPNNSQYIGMFP